MAVVEVTIFLVAVGKVAVLEVVVAKVATTSDAVVIVASALLKVVDVKAAPVLEGVDGNVDVLLVVVRLVPQQLKRLRLEGTELQGLFSWTASRRMRGRRASEVDTSSHLGCHPWSVDYSLDDPVEDRIPL